MFVTPRKSLLYSLLALVLALPWPAHAAEDYVVEVFPLGFRSVTEILPVIEPLVGPGGSVSGMRGQLVVQTTPARMAQVRAVLQQLDAPPARLLISVRRSGGQTDERRDAVLAGRVGAVAIGRGGAGVDTATGSDDVEIRGRIVQRELQQDATVTQQVQVLAGYEAWVETGTALSLYDGHASVPATTGFFVIPQLNGDQVRLELSTVSRRTAPGRHRSPYGATLATAGSYSTLSGTLGEWLDVAGAVATEQVDGRGIGTFSDRSSTDQSRLQVRVERLPD